MFDCMFLGNRPVVAFTTWLFDVFFMDKVYEVLKNVSEFNVPFVSQFVPVELQSWNELSFFPVNDSGWFKVMPDETAKSDFSALHPSNDFAICTVMVFATGTMFV